VSVGTTSPVSISVDDEVRRRGAVKKQAVVEGALEVPKDVLHDREMGLMGVVHVEAHLLDRVGNVRSSQGEVLESPSHVGGDLDLSVDRRGTGLADAHAKTFKDVPSILMLVEEVVVGLLRKWWRGPRSSITNCYWRAVVVCWRSSGLEAVRTMSLT
jgi:hypothetical protein